MHTRIGIYGDTISARIVGVNQLKQGQYGLFGSVNVVIDNYKREKNPNYNNGPNEPEFKQVKHQEFYFLNVGKVGRVLSAGITVGDIVIAKFEVAQFTPNGEQYARVELRCTDLLGHIRKVDLDTLKSAGLSGQQRQATPANNRSRQAPQANNQNRQQYAPQQQTPHSDGRWSEQPA